MESEILEKIKALPPQLKGKLEQDAFLSKADELESRLGVKVILILLKLILEEISYANLKEYLIKEYGFNDFLAEEAKNSIGELIKFLGETAPPKAVQPAAAPAEAVSMTFSKEDEAEIKKIKEVKPAGQKLDFNTQAETIITALSLTGLDETLKKRLLSIIVLRLKDVRDALETQEALKRNRKVGGLEFNEEQADAVEKAIKQFVSSGSVDSLKVALPTASPKVAKPVTAPIKRSSPERAVLKPEDDLLVIEDEDGLPTIKFAATAKGQATTRGFDSFSQPEKLSKEPQNVKIQNDTAQQISTAVNVNSTKATPDNLPLSREAVSGIKGKDLPPAYPAPFATDKKIPDSVLNSRAGQRPNLDGVKFEKKLAGPIEELSEMTMIDFRRIAADPQTVVNKIKEKIELLGEQGINKRHEGITAWHKNEVNKFYRLLGQASMAEDRPVEDVIKERLLAGKPTLAIDEFYAIMELNRLLRY